MAQEVKIVNPPGGDTDRQTNGPFKIGGVARTTNPTAVDNVDRVDAMFDDLGRQITVPYQVRDLIFTATASTATLAEVSLIAATAGVFNDLVEITCANNTGAAVSISVRDTTGGPVIKTINIAANGTTSRDFHVPIPQNVVATSWTVQNAGTGDISTTEVVVTATFIRNV